MDIKIYTIPGCHYCDKVKELFNIIGEQYSQVIIGRDLMKSEFDVEFPAAAGFPHVIIDGKEIGSMQTTAKYLVDKGYGKKLRQR